MLRIIFECRLMGIIHLGIFLEFITICSAIIIGGILE